MNLRFRTFVLALCSIGVSCHVGHGNIEKTWKEEPKPTAAFGSYCSVVKKSADHYELYNNTRGGGLKDGILRFSGNSLLELDGPEVVLEHEKIDDVFEKDGSLAKLRRFTRPSIVWHPRDGYFGVAHVCNSYGPKDGSVYPAFISSKSGKKGTWQYHGKLKGEIFDRFAPPHGRRWSDGRGLIYQPEYGMRLDHAHPTHNRFLYYSNAYPDKRHLALLYSKDGHTWFFYKKAGKIVNLMPQELRDQKMIFPHIIKTSQGWWAWLSETWKPKAIWRMHSDDGLTWKLFGKNQPEFRNTKDRFIKCISAYYDEQSWELWGILAIWEQMRPGFWDYRLHVGRAKTKLKNP